MTSKSKRGRPTGARNQATIVREVARMKTTITRAGKEERVTIAEAMVWLLERLTMTGNVAADRLLAKLRRRLAPEDDEQSYGIMVVPEPLSQHEWIRQQTILNQFRTPPELPASSAGPAPDGTAPPIPSGSGPPARPKPTDRPPWGNMHGRLIR
jgi:hypothetical protein